MARPRRSISLHCLCEAFERPFGTQMRAIKTLFAKLPGLYRVVARVLCKVPAFKTVHSLLSRRGVAI